jgi:hypothetical protein
MMFASANAVIVAPLASPHVIAQKVCEVLKSL